MNDREFFDLCYDQYKYELEEINAIYQRVGVILPAQVGLGAAVIALASDDSVHKVLTGIPAICYYGGGICALVTVVLSLGLVVASVWPRKCANLATMNEWKSWRDSVSETPLTGEQDGYQNRTAELRALMDATCEAQKKNAAINENRRRLFKCSVVAGAVAGILLLVQGAIWVTTKL